MPPAIPICTKISEKFPGFLPRGRIFPSSVNFFQSGAYSTSGGRYYQRMTRLLAAAGAALLLTQAAWAAAYEVPWDETCQLHSEDFTAGQTVDGILIRSVSTAADGSFCYGSRALRAGDVLPASALDAITLRPAAQRDGELALTYCPIVEGTLGS